MTQPGVELAISCSLSPLAVKSSSHHNDCCHCYYYYYYYYCMYCSYMATSGADRKLKIWDLRTLKQLSSCSLKAGAGHLAFSQRTLLGCAVDRQVQVSWFLSICF